jgi:hypothetical protein
MTAPLANPNVTGASAIIKAQLEAWGIGTLYGDAVKILKQGLNADAVIAQLQDTAAYKQRFWYNEQRKKAGLAVLSPAEAVATEAQMRGILRQFGLPAGFYDSPQDVGNFIAKNISASELADRATAARDLWLNAPAETQAYWKAHYGASDGDAIAAILNPDKALPLIQRKLAAANIGGAAMRQGLTEGTARAEQLATLGVTPDQAQQGFGKVAQITAGDGSIANRFGQDFTQGEAENAVFLQDAEALRKKQTLDSEEHSLFSGGAATNTAGLSGATGSR